VTASVSLAIVGLCAVGEMCQHGVTSIVAVVISLILHCVNTF